VEDSGDDELEGIFQEPEYECLGLYDANGARLPFHFDYEFEDQDSLCDEDEEGEATSDYLTMDDEGAQMMFDESPSVCYNDRTRGEGTRTYHSVLVVFWPRSRTLSYYLAHGTCNATIAKAQTYAKQGDKTTALKYLNATKPQL
jgi:hypothetical protein